MENPKATPKKAVAKRSKPAPPKPKPIATVSAQVASSINHASWITETDSGAVQLALKLALLIDGIIEPDELKAAAPAITSLVRLLNDLGLTTKGRPARDEAPEGVSWLDEIRERKAGTNSRSK